MGKTNRTGQDTAQCDPAQAVPVLTWEPKLLHPVQVCQHLALPEQSPHTGTLPRAGSRLSCKHPQPRLEPLAAPGAPSPKPWVRLQPIHWQTLQGHPKASPSTSRAGLEPVPEHQSGRLGWGFD